MKHASCGLPTYMRALRCQPQIKSAKQVIIPLLFGFAFCFIPITLNPETVIAGFYTCVMAFFCSMPLLWARTNKPNLCSVFPLSPGLRAAYSLLSAVVLFIFMELYVIAITFVINIPAMAVALAGGQDFFAIFKNDLVGIYLGSLSSAFSNVYSSLIFLSVIVYVFGAGLIFSHTDRERTRNIIAAAMFAVAEIGTVILCFAAEGRCFGNAFEAIENLSVPCLAAVVACALAIISLGFGIYLVIKESRPKHF